MGVSNPLTSPLLAIMSMRFEQVVNKATAYRSLHK
jgi:hypothetical protein